MTKFDFNDELESIHALDNTLDDIYTKHVLFRMFPNIIKRLDTNRLIIDIKHKLESKEETYKNDIGELSDGYHTFNELYHHRAVLFSVICNTYPDLAWKSLFHDDPNFPMYNGMFIVGIDTPEGQATYHYNIDPYWNIFNVKELNRAPKYDGHTSDEAIKRISSLSKIKPNNICNDGETKDDIIILTEMAQDIINDN